MGGTTIDLARVFTILGARVHVTFEHYDKAKDILERAFTIKVKHFGEDHIEVARTTLYYLAMVARIELGEYQKAAEMLERVLLVFEDHFGAHHDECCNEVRRALDLGQSFEVVCACPDGHPDCNC